MKTSKSTKTQKFKGKGSRAEISERQRRTLRLLGEGKSHSEIGDALDVHRTTVCRNLRELRETMTAATQADFEVYRKGQLSILELIEERVLEGKVAPDVAREWRAVRSDIAKLLGLNSPDKFMQRVDVGGANGPPVQPPQMVIHFVSPNIVDVPGVKETPEETKE